MSRGGCGCGEGTDCSTAAEDAEAQVPTCPAKLVLSHEEEAVLKIMRSYTDEGRALRAELKAPGIAVTDPRRREVIARLEQLRQLFKECKAELQLANEEKLRRLGHIP